MPDWQDLMVTPFLNREWSSHAFQIWSTSDQGYLVWSNNIYTSFHFWNQSLLFGLPSVLSSKSTGFDHECGQNLNPALKRITPFWAHLPWVFFAFTYKIRCCGWVWLELTCSLFICCSVKSTVVRANSKYGLEVEFLTTDCIEECIAITIDVFNRHVLFEGQKQSDLRFNEFIITLYKWRTARTVSGTNARFGRETKRNVSTNNMMQLKTHMHSCPKIIKLHFSLPISSLCS